MGEGQLSDAVGWESVRGCGMLMPKYYSDKWACLRNFFCLSMLFREVNIHPKTQKRANPKCSA